MLEEKPDFLIFLPIREEPPQPQKCRHILSGIDAVVIHHPVRIAILVLEAQPHLEILQLPNSDGVGVPEIVRVVMGIRHLVGGELPREKLLGDVADVEVVNALIVGSGLGGARDGDLADVGEDS